MNNVSSVQFGRTWVFDKAALDGHTHWYAKQDPLLPLTDLQLLRRALKGTEGYQFKPYGSGSGMKWDQIQSLKAIETPDVLIVEPHSHHPQNQLTPAEVQLTDFLDYWSIGNYLNLPGSLGYKLTRALPNKPSPTLPSRVKTLGLKTVA